jgi:hypothetical protein
MMNLGNTPNFTILNSNYMPNSDITSTTSAYQLQTTEFVEKIMILL